MPARSNPPRRLCTTAAVCLTALAGCGEQAPPPELPPRAIQWQRVTGSAVELERVISGIVTAIDETRLAFEVSGTVLTVDVELGDSVEAEQEMARLDPEPLELAISDAQAALAEARAREAHAISTLERYIAAGNAVAIQEVDRARANRDSRVSQREAAVARLNLAQRDLRFSVLKAPFRGSVSSREIEPAQTVAAGQVAFELDSKEAGLRVEVQMPETLIARVRQGDPATVTFPSLTDPTLAARGYAAFVSDVGTRAGTGNAFPVRADLEDAPAGLRPGMTAEVTFAMRSMDENPAGLEGFLIPLAAAHPDPDHTFSVFVFDPETSTVARREVRQGGVRENAIAVLEGLEEGEIIATAGVSFLRDGQKVTLLDERLMRGAQ